MVLAKEIKRFREQVNLIKKKKLNKYSLQLTKPVLYYVLVRAGVEENKAKEYADIVLDYFGLSNSVCDIVLSKHFFESATSPRSIFNYLLDLKILKSELEEELVCKFSPNKSLDYVYWRAHYWMWNYETIFDLIFREEDKKETNVYQTLPDILWENRNLE